MQARATDSCDIDLSPALELPDCIQVADLAEEKAFGYTSLLIHNEAWS